LYSMSRFQFGLVFVALLFLRIAVGFHFFMEGTSKLQSGTFTAKYFFADAVGPLAPFFRSMMEDPDGEQKLCVVRVPQSGGDSTISLDPTLTHHLWDQFVDEAHSIYDFGSPEKQRIIQARREELAKRIKEARQNKSGDVEVAEFERQRNEDEQSVLMIREQRERIEQILENHQLLLADFLDGNKTELLAHFETSNRLSGFDKDGASREKVATYVESLREQVETIKSDRRKKVAEWSAAVNAIWDSLEDQINSLPVPEQRKGKPASHSLHRPFDQVNSNLKWIDRIVPWFDTIVGILLLIGLFSRLASGAAAVFLVSVIATQPPWVPGAIPTYAYFIELAACLVIFATCAGRYGGLDFLLHWKPKRKSTNQ